MDQLHEAQIDCVVVDNRYNYLHCVSDYPNSLSPVEFLINYFILSLPRPGCSILSLRLRAVKINPNSWTDCKSGKRIVTLYMEFYDLLVICERGREHSSAAPHTPHTRLQLKNVKSSPGPFSIKF